MDSQAPIVPSEPPEVFPVPQSPILSQSPPPPSKQKDSHWISILAMAIFIVLSLGVVAFLYYQNQALKSMLASYQTPVPSSTPVPIAIPYVPNDPVISSPSANMKVTDPLKITGTVPAGWMSEGVFPIKLVDTNRKLIVQGQAKENIPGDWQSGHPVDFTATLTFKNASGSGFLILQNDNPSGDPANSKTFEMPVKFSEVITTPTPISSATPSTSPTTSPSSF